MDMDMDMYMDMDMDMDMDIGGGRSETLSAPGTPSTQVIFDIECTHQCSTFTGMSPVFGVLLILFGWYWYVVCESGM